MISQFLSRKTKMMQSVWLCEEEKIEERKVVL